MKYYILTEENKELYIAATSITTYQILKDFDEEMKEMDSYIESNKHKFPSNTHRISLRG